MKFKKKNRNRCVQRLIVGLLDISQCESHLKANVSLFFQFNYRLLKFILIILSAEAFHPVLSFLFLFCQFNIVSM